MSMPEKESNQEITRLEESDSSNLRNSGSFADALGTIHEDFGPMAVDSTSGSIAHLERCCVVDRTATFAIIIALAGVGVSGAFLTLGLLSAKRDQTLQFTRKAAEIVLSVKDSWDDYLGAAVWIHESCRGTADQITVIGEDLRICSRDDFSELYDYLLSATKRLTVQGIGFSPYLSHSDRASAQQEAFNYYAENYPGEVTYFGFTGFEVLPGTNETSFWLRSEAEYYLPIQYIEPVVPNSPFVGFDLLTLMATARDAEVKLLYEWQPVVTDRNDFSTIAPDSSYEPGYFILLVHPGLRLSNHPQDQPESASEVVFKVSNFAEHALGSQPGVDLEVYLFDVDKPNKIPKTQFLGWASSRGEAIDKPYGPGGIEHEPDLEQFMQKDSCLCERVSIAQNTWMVAVCHQSGYELELLHVILGSSVILLATLFLSFWFVSSQRKAAAIQKFRAHAEAEKSALILENAEKIAAQERELNAFLAHEVRNPLAAAMSASSFVASAIQQDRPLASEEAVESCRGDVHIIQSSLKFINDLLRSLLDMQKAASNRLALKMQASDIFNDVLEPVRTILDSKHNPFEFLIECPEHLVLVTDHLRLKQCIMNLASNSRKFVTEGYIRIGARIKPDNTVYLFCEDTGPGVPLEKRQKLFSRYQESLDSLNQGTGLGLSLSKEIVNLMEGELYLDETFDSGVPGFPGTRFIIETGRKPEIVDDDIDEKQETPACSNEFTKEGTAISATNTVLPEGLSVLIVDDDMILRRLINRSLSRIAPSWNFRQAANGETALKMAAEHDFDVIFLDQYMASAEKQLLGSETALAMRAQGVKSCICGLSANQIEDTFLSCGANAFIQKPFPCEKEALTQEVFRVLEAAGLLETLRNGV